MKLIVGLGNPGGKYEHTRHNLGFRVMEQFLKDFEPTNKTVWTNEPQFKSDIVHLEWQPHHGALEKVLLVKPKTYMNNSGMAVSLLASYYKIDPSDIWIVHDELDLPFGTMKIRNGGAAAGHHGVESVLEKLGTDKFWRFRLGIGGEGHHSHIKDNGDGQTVSKLNMKDVDDFVLGNFIGQERSRLKHLIKRASKALQDALEEGLEATMNRYNTK